jgi:ubiquitin-protein ligase
LVGIQDLLDNPNPDSPAHAEAYALFKYVSLKMDLIKGKTRPFIRKKYSVKPGRGQLRLQM